MADDKQQPKKDIPRLADGRPMPRDMQIKNELKVLEYRHVTALRQLADQTSKVRREELHKNLVDHQANHNIKNGKVAEARALLDKTTKDAERAHEEAVRKAKGDRQRAINEATKLYEDTRDTLERGVAEQNKPIAEAHQKRDAAIVDAAKQTVQEAAEGYEFACKPLKEELAMLELEQQEKQKRRTEREAEAKAVKEADEKRAAAATP